MLCISSMGNPGDRCHPRKGSLRERSREPLGEHGDLFFAPWRKDGNQNLPLRREMGHVVDHMPQLRKVGNAVGVLFHRGPFFDEYWVSG